MPLVSAIQKKSCTSIRPQGGEAQILPNGHFQDEALLLSVFRNHPHACADRVQRRMQLDRLSVDPDISPARLINSKKRLQQLAATGADEPGDAHDFPGPNREAQLMARTRRSAQSFHTQERVCDYVGPPLVKLRKRTSDH